MVMDHKRAFVPRTIRDTGLQVAFRDTGYLSPTGHLEYLDLHAKHLIFGEELWKELGGLNKVVAAQTIGGTGSLFVASEFLNEVLTEEKRNLLLDPGWANHKNIFAKIDNTPTTYIHEDSETREYNHKGYLEVLNNHPEGCPVLLQVAGYNLSLIHI